MVREDGRGVSACADAGKKLKFWGSETVPRAYQEGRERVRRECERVSGLSVCKTRIKLEGRSVGGSTG